MKRLPLKSFLMFILTELLLFSVFPPFSSVKSTQIVSDISVNTVWAAANGPYEIKSDIRVYSGVTLSVEPGVIVSFDNNTSLTVEGSLIAVGNSSNRIIFTSNHPNPTRGQWTNIRFFGGGNESFIVRFADVMYAQNGIVIESSGNAVIERSRITNNFLSGVHVVGPSNVAIRENTIQLNRNGITTEGSTSSGIQIVGNTIVSNDESGVYVSSSGADACRIYNTTISGNDVSRNGDGIYVFSNAGTENDEAHIYDVAISNNRISSNHYGIRLRTHAWQYGYIYDSTIDNNTILLNDEGIDIHSGSNWYSWISDVTISNNKVLANERGVSLYGFRTPQLPYKPTPFDTAIVENIVSANNNTGISITGDVRANLTGNSVAYNSYGVYLTSKDNRARNNDIYRNPQYGMYVTDVGAIKAQINAEGNFWGAANGPFHAILRPNGDGDAVNGDGSNLDFSPFLDASLGYINDPPVATLRISETRALVNQTINFDGVDSADDLSVMNYFFDFGDHGSSGWIDVPVVRHRYVARGLYNASLIVMDEFGVKSNRTVESVMVTLASLEISVFFYPPTVFSQGQVQVEIGVTDEAALGVKDVFVQLTSDEGGDFDPAFGYTDSDGDFNSTFFAPAVAESTGVEITVTASKVGYENSSKPFYLSVLKATSDGANAMSWIWPVAILAVIAGASVVLVVKLRRKPKQFVKRKARLRTRQLLEKAQVQAGSSGFRGKCCPSLRSLWQGHVRL